MGITVANSNNKHVLRFTRTINCIISLFAVFPLVLYFNSEIQRNLLTTHSIELQRKCINDAYGKINFERK